VDPQFPFAFLSVKQRLGTCTSVSREAYRIDNDSGVLRNAASSPVDGDGFLGPQPAVVVDSSGRFIYVLDESKNVLIEYALDLRSGPNIPGALSDVRRLRTRGEGRFLYQRENSKNGDCESVNVKLRGE